MRTSPSIAPHGPEQDTYLVLDDFGGRLGRAWRETDENATDRETLIRDLVEGQFNGRSASSPSIPLKDGPAM
jgi:hypothetical protein